jgi:hypothetical protein
MVIFAFFRGTKRQGLGLKNKAFESLGLDGQEPDESGGRLQIVLFETEIQISERCDSDATVRRFDKGDTPPWLPYTS